MENKLYDLIVKLIKQHRKYSACAEILDDIANDVYDSASKVLKDINDEQVVTAYLTKLVSTSIVNVSKRLNVNLRQAVKNTEIILPQTVNTDTAEAEIIEEQELIIGQESVEPEDTVIIETDDTPSDSKDSEDQIELINNDNAEQLDEVIQENQGIEEISVDKDLVDKMINGFSNNENTTEEDFENELETFEISNDNDDIVDSQIDEDYEDLEDLCVLDDSMDDTEDTEDGIVLSEEESNESYFVEEENDIINLETEEGSELSTEDVITSAEDSIEQIDEDVENEDSTSSDIIDFSDSDSLEISDDVDNFDIDSNQEEMFLEEDINSSPDEAFEAEQDIFDIEEISDTISSDALNTDLPVEENKKYSVSIDFSSRFDCFEYEPDAPQYDSETICAELIELDNKHPEKQILKICELKYYQKKSITEIADILGIPDNAVLEALNEIIDIAKEQ